MAQTIDYAVSPGDILLEWLEENDFSQAALATKMGASTKLVSSIVNGGSLTTESIVKLSRATGISEEFWSKLEAIYQADLVRMKESSQLSADDLELIDKIPCSDLRRRGFLKETKRNMPKLLQELLAFFRVGTIDALRKQLSIKTVAFRQNKNVIDNIALATWLYLGEVEASKLEKLPKFNKEELRRSIPDMRRLVNSPPDHFGVELVKILAKSGVRLLYIEDVKGTATYGATWWDRENPVIQLSLRNKDDGNFWFTLFHEIGHVVLHSKNEVFVNFANSENAQNQQLEDEANVFARDLLISADKASELENLKSTADVVRFAEEIKVSAGVVVGRLQHDRLWPHHMGNSLKMNLGISVSDDGV